MIHGLDLIGEYAIVDNIKPVGFQRIFGEGVPVQKGFLR